MNRLHVALLLVVSLLAVGCGFEHSSSPAAPSSTGAANSPAAGTNTAPSLVGLWTSNALPTLPGPNTCGNFQFEISSQTATSVTGRFSATCGGGLAVSGTASGQLNGTSVPLSVSGMAAVSGTPSCTFTLNGVGAIIDGGNTLTVPFSGTTCLGPISGTEVLHRPAPAAPAADPTPAPAPPAPPPPPSAPSAPGGFSLGAVTIVGSPDVLGWPVTSRITSLTFSPGTLHIDHSRRGQWPAVVIADDGTTQEATIWVFFQINGRWYATGGERLRPGQADKALRNPSEIGPDWLYDPGRWAPMAGYVPSPGELVGFMVAAGSTRVDNNAPVHERTGVILVPFPADGTTARFPPFAWEE